MAVEPIDELIRAGWEVIETDYEPAAFDLWRQKALVCLVELLGPNHAYTQYFENRMRASASHDLCV